MVLKIIARLLFLFFSKCIFPHKTHLCNWLKHFSVLFGSLHGCSSNMTKDTLNLKAYKLFTRVLVVFSENEVFPILE